MFRYTLFIFIFLALVQFASFAQPGELNWIKTLGSIQLDLIENHVVDHEQNVIAVGYFHNTISLGDLHFTSKGESDIILFKVNQHGNVLWANTLGGPEYHGDCGVDVDASGNIYLTGGFVKELYLNNTLKLTSTSNYWNSFVAKFSATGESLWFKHISGNEVRVMGCISVNDAGDVIVCGNFDGNVKIDSHEVSMGIGNPGNNLFYLRLSSTGTVVWLTHQYSETHLSMNDIHLDNDGSFYGTGFFTTTAYFGPQTLTAANDTHGDIFITKYDFWGNPIWAVGAIKTSPAELNNEGTAITVSETKEVYVTGVFKGEVQFGSHTLTAPNTNEFSGDVFLTKLTEDGDVVWAKRIATDGVDFSNSIKMDRNEAVVISGALNFKPFISQYTTDGIQEWQKDFNVNGYGLTIDFLTANNIFLSGGYLSPFQTTLGTEPHRGETDAFILNLKKCVDPSEYPVKPLINLNCDLAVITNYDEGYQINWYANNQLISQNKDTAIHISKFVPYRVVFSNVCGQNESEEVEFSPATFEVYNFFSPNTTDDINSHYELPDPLLGASLAVYNRWGILVYESSQYFNTWDGGQLASGVYFYVIRHNCYGKFMGPLTLIR